MAEHHQPEQKTVVACTTVVRESTRIAPKNRHAHFQTPQKVRPLFIILFRLLCYAAEDKNEKRQLSREDALSGYH